MAPARRPVRGRWRATWSRRSARGSGERLTEALATADLLVRAATVRFDETAPTDPRAVAAMAAYFAEIGERFGFEPGDAWQQDADSMAAPDGFFVVATSDGEPVACGGVQRLPDGAAEIKRMWVHDGWRGAGLGARLLRHLEDLARERGHAVVRLDTNDTLVEAIAMYERAGYRLDRALQRQRVGALLVRERSEPPGPCALDPVVTARRRAPQPCP